MGSVKIRHLVAKPQRGGHTLWYWQPAKALRDAGFLPRRLAERTNTMADAVAQAELLNAEVDAWRAGIVGEPAKHGTLPWLVKLYRKDAAYERLADSTKRGYDAAISAIEAWSKRAGHPQVSALTRLAVGEFRRSMPAGAAKTNATMRVLRLLLFFARGEGIINDNPADRPRLQARPPRQTVWSPDALAAFCGKAIELGRPSMALAVQIGVNTGQREGDILALGWSQWDGIRVRLRQRKTGKLVDVPATAELRQVLAEAPRKATTILVSEATGLPYKPDFFRHEFARIRSEAKLSELLFMDLRRTAVVRLAEAGATVPEIAAITGHEIDRTARIIETYLPRTAAMAGNAIAKLDEHRSRTELENQG